MSDSQLVSFGTNTVTDATTEFMPLSSHLPSTTTETNVEVPIRDAGTFSKLYVRVTANDVGSDSTCTLRKSQADTALVATITANTTGVFEDTTNSVSFAATDEADFELTVPAVGGTHTVTVTVIGVVFTPTTTSNTISYLVNAIAATFSTASATSYMPCQYGAVTSTETNCKLRIRTTVTTSDLYVRISANARTTNTIFKTRKNGSDGGQSVTVGSTATGAFEDTSGTDSLSTGDDYNYAITTGTGTETITRQLLSTSAITTDDKFLFMSSYFDGISDGINVSGGATANFALSGILNTATENNTKITPRFTITLSELHAYSPANTCNASSTIKVRDNGANGNLSLSIGASATGLFADSANIDIITSATDTMNTQVIGGGSGTLTVAWIGVMGATPSSIIMTQWYRETNQYIVPKLQVVGYE